MEFRWIFPGGDISDPLSVRRKVFIEEQGYTEQQEVIPEEEAQGLHLCLYDNGVPVGSGRLTPEAEKGAMHAGRIALLPEYRGRGLGRQMVEQLTEQARRQGAEKVYIGAQKYAVPFYEKCGYRKCSVEYPDGHIPHILMEKSFVLVGVGWLGFGDEYDAVVFRRDFTADYTVKKAQIELLPLGFFECYLNGRKITEDLYAPAWTDYVPRDTSRYIYPIRDTMCHRAYAVRYDVTELLQKGENALAVHIGNGWYGQKESKNEGVNRYGEMLLCYRLRVEDESGTEHVYSSDDGGFYRQSYIEKTSMYFGEYHDYRKFSAGLFTGNTLGWKRTTPAAPPDTIIEWQTCPADRVLRRIEQAKTLYSFGDVKIYDIGENLAGFIVLKFPEKADTNHCITVRYAENLNEDGSLNFHSIGGSFRLGTDCFRMGERDSGHELLYPHFLWHAGRYVEVRGEHEFVCFCLAASDIPVTADFACSDETLNWLFQAYVRTQQSNIHCCVPSDCPHRERLGYTGDGQLTARAVMTVFDAKPLYEKWMRDIADCQDMEGGHVQHTAPFYGGGGGPGGWGGAMVAVPWYFYEFYGDKTVLEKYYIHMKKYLDYMQSRCDDGIVMREEPGGWCLGDWCPPYGMPKIPEPYVNTVFYIRFLGQTCRAAEILGRTGDLPELRAREAQCRQAVTRQYFNPETGSFCEGIEGADAFAVDIGLGDERTVRNLAEKYEKLGMYDTGIFGTDLVTKTLFEKGYASLAFRLLSGRGEVSFGHMMQGGATTLWENWFNENSSSHPMFGAVVEYLFRYILGIRQAENLVGFADIQVQPACIPELEWARGSVKTPAGTVSVQVRRGKLEKMEIL